MERRSAVALTAREREVASLISRGLTNRQIGLDLAIKERTVGAHVQNILNKLGAGNRAQIAAWAAANGAAPARVIAAMPAPPVAPATRSNAVGRPGLQFGWLAGLLLALTLVVAATDDGSQGLLPLARPPSVGSLAYQATLAGDGDGFSVRYILGDPSWSAIRFVPGAVEYSVLQPGGNTGHMVATPPFIRYFEEVELSVTPDSNVEFWMTLTNEPGGMSSHILDLSVGAEAMQLIYFIDQNTVPVSPQVAVKGLQSGRTVTISMLVNPPRYAVYLDGSPVIDVQHDVLAPYRGPGFGIFGQSGTVRLTKLRIFHLN
jgi:DNA-binding CsgD family transcriptional regulator